MSLDLSTPLLPAPTPFSSPDFITTQSRRASHTAAETQRGDSQVGNAQSHPASTQPIVDRRVSRSNSTGYERRQFGSSHANLSPAAAELAVAIDQYKLEHRRRYITCEEMLMVITKLGYSR